MAVLVVRELWQRTAHCSRLWRREKTYPATWLGSRDGWLSLSCSAILTAATLVDNCSSKTEWPGSHKSLSAYLVPQPTSGTYSLSDKRVKFNGKMRMKAALSQATTGGKVSVPESNGSFL